MSCTIYMVNYNYAFHTICMLALMAYKNNELQMSSTTQKFNCKASCETPFFHIMREERGMLKHKPHLLKIAYYYRGILNLLCQP